MWSVQAVRESKIHHTQPHLSALRGTPKREIVQLGRHWNTDTHTHTHTHTHILKPYQKDTEEMSVGHNIATFVLKH